MGSIGHLRARLDEARSQGTMVAESLGIVCEAKRGHGLGWPGLWYTRRGLCVLSLPGSKNCLLKLRDQTRWAPVSRLRLGRERERERWSSGPGETPWYCSVYTCDHQRCKILYLCQVASVQAERCVIKKFLLFLSQPQAAEMGRCKAGVVLVVLAGLFFLSSFFFIYIF